MNRLSPPFDVSAIIERVRQCDALASDIETTGLNPWRGDTIQGVSLAAADWSTYLPWSHPDSPNITAAEQRALMKAMSDVPTLIGHNCLFDFSFLVPAGLHVEASRIHDTMTWAWLADENRRLGLKELTGDAGEQHKLKALMRAHCVSCGGTKSRLVKFGDGKVRACANQECEVSEGWQLKRDWGDLTYEEMAPYATRDAELTWQLYTEQAVALENPYVGGVDYKAFRREMEILELCLRMTAEGLPVDLERVEHEAQLCHVRAVGLAAGFPVEIGSPKQVGEYLTERGLELPETPTGKPQTDRDALLPYQPDPVVKRILEYRDVTKEGQFYEKMLALVGTDGRVHPRWRPTGTVSGRFSCSDPNAQQWPRAGGVRGCVVAPMGYVLLSADLSQAELRVAAHYAQCERLIEWFNNEEDVYQHVADELGITRQSAKVVVLSSLYGVGARKLRLILLRAGVVASQKEAKVWLDGWRSLVPELDRGRSRAERVAIERGYVRLIQPGRYRHFAGAEYWRADPRDAWNAIIQGGVAECVKSLMLILDKKAAPLGVKLIAQVHDSLSFFVPEGGEDEWKAIVEDEWYMLNPFDVTIPLEFKSGI